MSTDRTCSVDGCERPHLCRALCKLHYDRLRRTGATELAQRSPVLHPPLTAERLRELLDYDPATGVFRRHRGSSAGIAGSINDKLGGYRMIHVAGKLHYAHRLAWLHVYGKWPDDQIDHRNGERDDNRIANLRQATNGQNIENRHQVRSDSKSGLLGVQLHKQTGKWRARIRVGGRNRHLGLFDTPGQAADAYAAAKRKLHPFWVGA